MRIKTLKPYWTYDDDGDHAALTAHVPMRSRDIGWAMGKARARLIEDLIDSDIVQPSGCDCSHCRNDWDCCGRMVPGTVDLTRVKGGVRVTQNYYRNV